MRAVMPDQPEHILPVLRRNDSKRSILMDRLGKIGQPPVNFTGDGGLGERGRDSGGDFRAGHPCRTRPLRPVRKSDRHVLGTVGHGSVSGVVTVKLRAQNLRPGP